jgi:hypothetical protein
MVQYEPTGGNCHRSYRYKKMVRVAAKFGDLASGRIAIIGRWGARNLADILLHILGFDFCDYVPIVYELLAAGRDIVGKKQHSQ